MDSVVISSQKPIWPDGSAGYKAVHLEAASSTVHFYASAHQKYGQKEPTGSIMKLRSVGDNHHHESCGMKQSVLTAQRSFVTTPAKDARRGSACVSHRFLYELNARWLGFEIACKRAIDQKSSGMPII